MKVHLTTKNTAFTKFALGAICTGALGFGAGVLEARCPLVRHFEVPILPSGRQPIRVLHISDLHLLPRQLARIRFVHSLADLDPDLVISTGDNLASGDAITAVLDAYGPLFDKPGAFVFGSNDYYGPVSKNPLSYFFENKNLERASLLPADVLEDALTSRGWVSLNNRRAVLDIAGQSIELRGTNDAHLRADDYAAVGGPASPGVDLSLGVTHSPYLKLLDAMTDDGVSLILAGHTHGGQVCLPLKGALTTNCDLEPRRAKGLHPHHTSLRSSWLHVSAGLGTSPLAPYRLFCRPEVSLLTLTSAEPNA